MRCMLLTMNGTLDAVIRVVESLYERGISREELYQRRRRAWDMYLALVARMELNPQLGHHHVALRACLLVFITRSALQRQCPRILASWYAMGDRGDPDNRSMHLGNLWSSNFLGPNYEIEDDEKCPHRDHNLSLQRPYHGFDNVEREELRDGL